MIFVERKLKYLVISISLLMGILIFSSIFLNGEYIPLMPYLVPLNQRTNNLFALGIMVVIVPLSIIEFNNNRWLKAVDKHIPRLLMDVTESIRSGLSLFNALEVAATRDYGPITKELESAMVNFRITSDFEGSMKYLGERLKRPNAKRLVTILMETYETGGRIDDILDTSIDMFTAIDEYKEERDSQIGPYVLLVYIGALIFLIISWTIVTQFVQPVIDVSQQEHVAESGILTNVLDINYYISILFWASLIEGLVGGLVAGKIVHGRISGGLIHSVFLLVMSLIFFNTLIR